MPIGKLDIAMTLDAAGVTKGVKAAQKQIDAFGVAIGTAIGTIAVDAFRALSDAVIGSMTEGLAAMEKFNDAATKLGQGLEGGTQLAALSRGLQELGVDSKDAQEQVLNFATVVGEALTNKPSVAARTLNKLGVALKDATGQVRPMADIMQDTVNALATYNQGVGVGTAATILFGESADENANTLAAQKEAILTAAAAAQTSAAAWQTFAQTMEAANKAGDLL